MELLQLKYFCDAAITENFSHTAKKFYVPASNISQSIKRLEKELGVLLFARSANKIVLSERGKIFYKEVKEALDRIEHAKRQMIGTTEQGTIKIGIYVNRRIAMQAVGIFQKCFPKINMIIEHDILQYNEDFDLIISDGELEVWDYYKEKIFCEDVVLAYKKGMIDESCMDLTEDVKEKPFITMSSGNSIFSILQDVSQKLGFEPRIALMSEDPYYIRKCVELGLGVVFVPEKSWKGQFSSEIQFVKIEGITRDTYIYRHNKRYMPEYVKAFLDIIKQEFKSEE